MSRPIDADALMRAMYHRAFETDGDTMWQSGCWVRYRAIEQTVKEQPTIEPERKTGKWVHGREIAREMVGDAVAAIFYEGWQCSECKCIVEEEREPLWNFCPNCGADMRGEQDG